MKPLLCVDDHYNTNKIVLITVHLLPLQDYITLNRPRCSCSVLNDTEQNKQQKKQIWFKVITLVIFIFNVIKSSAGYRVPHITLCRVRYYIQSFTGCGLYYYFQCRPMLLSRSVCISSASYYRVIYPT